MFMRRGLRLSDIDEWERRGWLTDEGVAGLKAAVEQRWSPRRFAGALAVLAAVLVGCGIMSFVAANWQELSKLSRLALIAAGLWGSLLGSTWLRANAYERFAEAALLLAVLIFGAGIMLIAQMYHMDGHPPDAFLLWAVGGLAVGVLAGSAPALLAALALFAVWSAMESGFGGMPRIHWAFLPAWLAVAAGFYALRWRQGVWPLAVTALAWLMVSLGTAGDLYKSFPAKGVMVMLGLAFYLAGDRLAGRREDTLGLADVLQPCGAVLAFVGAYAAQASWRGVDILVPGILILAGVLAFLWHAWAHNRRSIIWLAYAGFVIEVVTIYIAKVGTLLGTAGFFIGAGVVVAGLAFAAHRLRIETANRNEVLP